MGGSLEFARSVAAWLRCEDLVVLQSHLESAQPASQVAADGPIASGSGVTLGVKRGIDVCAKARRDLDALVSRVQVALGELHGTLSAEGLTAVQEPSAEACRFVVEKYGRRMYEAIAAAQLNRMAPLSRVLGSRKAATVFGRAPSLRGASLEQLSRWVAQLKPHEFMHTARAVIDAHIVPAVRRLRKMDMLIMEAAIEAVTNTIEAYEERFREEYVETKRLSKKAVKPQILLRVNAKRKISGSARLSFDDIRRGARNQSPRDRSRDDSFRLRSGSRDGSFRLRFGSSFRLAGDGGSSHRRGSSVEPLTEKADAISKTSEHRRNSMSGLATSLSHAATRRAASRPQPLVEEQQAPLDAGGQSMLTLDQQLQGAATLASPSVSVVKSSRLGETDSRPYESMRNMLRAGGLSPNMPASVVKSPQEAWRSARRFSAHKVAQAAAVSAFRSAAGSFTAGGSVVRPTRVELELSHEPPAQMLSKLVQVCIDAFRELELPSQHANFAPIMAVYEEATFLQQRAESARTVERWREHESEDGSRSQSDDGDGDGGSATYAEPHSGDDSTAKHDAAPTCLLDARKATLQEILTQSLCEDRLPRVTKSLKRLEHMMGDALDEARRVASEHPPFVAAAWLPLGASPEEAPAQENATLEVGPVLVDALSLWPDASAEIEGESLFGPLSMDELIHGMTLSLPELMDDSDSEDGSDDESDESESDDIESDDSN